jgi:hypothetical protein
MKPQLFKPFTTDTKLLNEAAQMLVELVDLVQVTGGVTVSRTGLASPVGDPDWIDLGELAVKAHDFLQDAGYETELKVERKDEED